MSTPFEIESFEGRGLGQWGVFDRQLFSTWTALRSGSATACSKAGNSVIGRPASVVRAQDKGLVTERTRGRITL